MREDMYGNDDPYNDPYAPPKPVAGSASSYVTPGTPVATAQDTTTSPPAAVQDPNRRSAIEGYYKQYLGRNADEGGLNAYLNDPNASLSGIESSIKGSDEAKQWIASQQPKDWSKVNNWDANTVNDYFKSRGVAPNGTSPQYWADQWNKWGKGDPAYFMKFLSNAEEFTGGSAQTAAAMGFAPGGGAAAPGGSAPGGNSDAMLHELLDRINKQQTAADAEKAANTAKSDALYGTLMDRSKQGLAIDRNDPTIRAQSDAYRANTDRSTRNYLADLAEKSGPLANLRGEQRMATEHAGQAAGSFEAELMGRELTAKRQEISDALNGMRGMLTADQQANLQQQLADMDARISAARIQQQGDQFGSDLGFRYTQLGQQGSQFDRNLGFQYEGMDNDMLKLLLSRLG